jgi:hypothetical protein
MTRCLAISLAISLALSLALFGSVAKADRQLYWVLGSFHSEDNARIEQHRVAQALGVSVQIRVTPDGLLRLLLLAESVSPAEIEALVLDAWRIRLPDNLESENGESAGVEVLPAISTQASKDLNDEEVSELDAIVEIIAVPNLPALEPGQSLQNYCEGLGDRPVDFCADSFIESVDAAANQLVSRQQALRAYCDRANLSRESLDICQRLSW